LPISFSSSKDLVLHCPACLRERGELIRYAPRQRYCVLCQSEQLQPLEMTLDGQEGPEPEDVLRDPAASFWLKAALRSALGRDPVDAANDAEVLAQLLDRRCRLAVAKDCISLRHGGRE
jgi:hypothetical protein